MTSRCPLPWLARPGLAGGIDKDGGRAGELLGLGFGSVEFGSVGADAPAREGLVARLAAHRAAAGRQPAHPAIGVGLGLPETASPRTLADEWLAGLDAVSPVADYLSLNLSARANRRFLDPACRPRLLAALRAVGAMREQLAAEGRRVALAIKLPVGEAASLIEAAAACGFEQMTVVLPDDGDRLSELTALAGRRLLAVVAVGGIRSAADVAALRAAGASGVQVHRLFAELGAACLPRLIGLR